MTRALLQGDLSEADALRIALQMSKAQAGNEQSHAQKRQVRADVENASRSRKPFAALAAM